MESHTLMQHSDNFFKQRQPSLVRVLQWSCYMVARPSSDYAALKHDIAISSCLLHLDHFH
jgi:hypothetical protein